MSQSLLPADEAYRRLDLFVPKLIFMADWVQKTGERLQSEALSDSIPFALRCLASEVEQIRDDLKPFQDTGQG